MGSSASSSTGGDCGSCDWLGPGEVNGEVRFSPIDPAAKFGSSALCDGRRDEPLTEETDKTEEDRSRVVLGNEDDPAAAPCERLATNMSGCGCARNYRQ